MSQIDWFKLYQENFDALEATLKNLELWSLTPPSDEALQSSMPFAVDTLSFEQWLQFIFLPNMRMSLAQKRLPPGPAQLLPAAEEVYKDKEKHQALLEVLRKFDEISILSHLH